MNDPQLQGLFAPYLGSREVVRWSGRPKQGVMLSSADAFHIPFSLLWGGFSIVWLASAIAMGAPWEFALFGVPFVLIGLYMIVGRFFVDSWLRARTAYAITDTRALVLSRAFGERLTAVDLATTPEVRLIRHKDERGTIEFGPASFPFGAGFESWGLAARLPSFRGIEDAVGVYRLAEAVRAEVRAGRPDRG